MPTLIETSADAEIKECLQNLQNFSVIAGAGSGKTTSLLTALRYLRDTKGQSLRQNAQRILCITYTNRAVEVITERLEFDDIFYVSTLHSFLWGEIKRFGPNIRDIIREYVIPEYIQKKQAEDNGGTSQRAIAARAKVASLQADLESVSSIDAYKYEETTYSNFSEGVLGHDDVISIAANLIQNNAVLRKILGQKYPYIFVDEAQDTFLTVVEALNTICENEGLPIIGYFGDPMQQIYDKRAGDFEGPEGSRRITKEENFRCSQKVIDLLNAFRTDVTQIPAGVNAQIEGSVSLRLVTAETPEGPRNSYTDEQIERASRKFDQALESWNLKDNPNVKQLFLVRQMIARRLGFPTLNRLFTGRYASTKAQDDYESGDHFLLKPFINCLCPIIEANSQNNPRKVLDVLRRQSPAFDPNGINAQKSLGEMKTMLAENLNTLVQLWQDDTTGQILRFVSENNLYRMPEILLENLNRDPRTDEFDPDQHTEEKGDWLADEFLQMPTPEIQAYADFIDENTPFSTQHGVKGEEYKNVVVVFDDVEAAWHNYNFSKTLTPNTYGEPTEGQLDRTRKLAYVCFSRAEENLRILMFSLNPNSSRQELLEAGLLSDDQIEIVTNQNIS